MPFAVYVGVFIDKMPKNVVDFFSFDRKSAANEIIDNRMTAESAWEVCYTEDGYTYYYNNSTGVSSWDYPEDFQSDLNLWEEHYTEDGDVYYYNNVTQCSQWEYLYESEVQQQSEPYDELEWMEYCTEDGIPYYYNVYTEAVQWEYPYQSYDYASSYQSVEDKVEPEPLYASESSSDRHLEIWAKFFENAFAAQESMEEERERRRSKALNRAAKAAKLEAVMNQWPSRLNEKRFKALMSGALGNRDLVEDMVGDDEDLNDALLAAITQEHFASAESLLFAGANPNCADQHIRSATHYAAKTGNAEILALLYDQGADLEMCDQVGRTPLHIAALFGRESVAEFLLACAVNVDGPGDHSGNTPLHLSARGGHAGIVRVLLQFGASTKLINSGGMTALEIAQTMQPQTSELAAVVAAFKADKKSKKKPKTQGTGLTTSPTKKSAMAVSAAYQNVRSDWFSDAETSPVSSSGGKATSSRSAQSAVDRDWKLSMSKSSSSSAGGGTGLSEHVLASLRNRVNATLDNALTRLLSKLPPLSPMVSIVSTAANAEQADFRIKLKPFLIEEALTFPANCPATVEQLLDAARAQHNLGHFEEALRYLEAAGKKVSKQSSAVVEMYITLCKGNVYQSCGDDEQSLLTYMEGWTRASTKNDLDWEVIAINAIGILAYYNLRFDVALLCFHLVGNYRVDVSEFISV